MGWVCCASASSERPERTSSGRRSRGPLAWAAPSAAATFGNDHGSTGPPGRASERATLEVLSTASGETNVHLRLVRAGDDAVVHDRVRETVQPGERAVFELLDETTVSART